MDFSLYMENAGATAGMRALFSYMTEPQGSYYLPMIFSNVLKKKKISFAGEEKHRWNNFLADYFVFRLFIARHVLKTYAAEYTPLLYAFRGISKLEENFPKFLQPDRFRKDSKILLSLSDADLSAYTPERIAGYHRFFEEISKKAELRFNEPDRVLKAITEEALTSLSRKNGVFLYAPVLWFFDRETKDYAAYLSSFFQGFIPVPDLSPEEMEKGKPSESRKKRKPNSFFSAGKAFPAVLLLTAIALACLFLAAQ